MASTHDEEQRQLLQGEPSSSYHQDEQPSQAASFQQSQGRAPAVKHRTGYAKVPFVSFLDEHEREQADVNHHERIQTPEHPTAGRGLGISSSQPLFRAEFTITQPVQAYDSTGNVTTVPYQSTSRGVRPPMSSPLTGGMSGSTQHDSPHSEVVDADDPAKISAKHSHASLHSSSQPSGYASSGSALLPANSGNDTFAPEHHCNSATEIKQTRFAVISLAFFALAIYGTVMSAIFVVIAIHGPGYGPYIRTQGRLTISGATIITTFFAKTIELSFVAVIIALLGQALARKAHDGKATNGITLAEIGMRSWILQPGTVFTHWESVRYAGFTVLGMLSLLSAVLATLYVTAANAVVQPQLKFTKPRTTPMKGLVKTSFANPVYLKQECKTPIAWQSEMYADKDGGTTCLQLEHAAMGFHNYYAYLSTWSDLSKSGNGAQDLQTRPNAFAIMNDNTTITGAWIEQEFNNMSKLYDDYGFVVINVSMAMPHVGVASAAIDPINEILQPADLDGQGVYRVHASVPSPAVHVLCAMLSAKHLAPIVWTNGTFPYDPYLGGTPLDKLFKWGEDYGEFKWPPVFPKLPLGHNTLINGTLKAPIYGREATYLLGNSTFQGQDGGFIYPLCQLTVNLTPHCSTWYNASSSGAAMSVVCEDPNDKLAYIHSVTNATDGNATLIRDWSNVAEEWLKSLALNSAALRTNGSNSLALNQLVPKQPAAGTSPSLDPMLPSIAEALAVMAGCTLFMSARDAPFVIETWNYTSPDNIMDPGNYQYFNASVEAQEYASGGTAKYQHAFIAILAAVFLLNLVALAYFAAHRGWYADVSEPSNLFVLAINSPPSEELAGSCGGASDRKQFCASWKLQDEHGHLYMKSVKFGSAGETATVRRRRRFRGGFDIMMTPIRSARESLAERRSG